MLDQAPRPAARASLAANTRRPRIPSIWYHDLSVALDTPMDVRFIAGIRNVFNDGPRDRPFTARGNQSMDDLIGNLFFLGAKWRFGGQ